VVVTDVDPDEVIQDATRYVDIDNDGDPELYLRESIRTRLYDEGTADRLSGAVGEQFTFAAPATSTITYAVPLPRRALIGPTNVDGLFLGDLRFTSLGDDPMHWIGAGTRFVGLGLGLDGLTHYGYLAVRMEQAGQIILKGYAYEATPDTPIAAGAEATIVLDGTVNQTSFPPEGGTLVYTFTVTNTGPNPVPLDLSVKARQNGFAVLTQLLGSGTLPAGATVTRSVSLNVPASAPSGEYRVTFRAGDFEGGRHYAAETLTITKEPGAAAGGPVAGGSGALTAAALPGDLFAAGPVTAAGVAATHTLSAARPNPASGRTELTLEVAEVQHVRVEVLDALGRRVAVLHDGVLAAGAAHAFTFEGSSLPAGVYAVRAVGDRFSDVRTVTLAR
jgi:hypothetical protein